MFSPPARPTHRAPGRAVVNYRALAAPVGRSVGGAAVLGAVTATGSLVAIPEAEAYAPADLSSSIAGTAPVVPVDENLPPEAQKDIATYTVLTLRSGAQGTSINYLQARLNDRGAGIAVNGSFDPATRRAVEAVQTNGGVTVDGVVGPSTWDLLVNTSAQDVPAFLPEAPESASAPAVVPDEAKYAPQVLRYGATGEAISYLQARLNDRGAGIPEDGRFGPATRTAVRALQSNAGIAVDGVVGPATWNVLFNATAEAAPAVIATAPEAEAPAADDGLASFASSVLRYGDRGDAVSYLQARLNDRGADIPEDGRFGPATRTAVRALQGNGGNRADGVVGPATWSLLIDTSAEDVPAYVTESAPVWDGESMVAMAKEQLGTPYVWGSADPSRGLDCSGLVKYVYNAHGIEVPRVAKNQVYGGEIISQSEAKPGDLVAFSSGDWGHIGIYAGNGKVVDASNSRGKVVFREIWDSPHVFVSYR